MSTRSEREAALLRLDERIAANPGTAGLRIERARLLAELGRTDEARVTYIEVLKLEPTDRIALNELGALLYSTGYRTAARTAFSEAVARHPNDAISRLCLANSLYENGEFGAARDQYEAALRCAPGLAEAHRGLSWVLSESGDLEAAARHRRLGFAENPVQRLRYCGEAEPIRALLLISAVGGNVRALELLENTVFETTMLVAEFFDLKTPLPAHDIVFNAIGDADLAREGLEAAQSIVSKTSAPVLNPPATVKRTGRADNALRLTGIRGAVVPRMAELPRDVLTGPAAVEHLKSCGLDFPLLIRTPGFHTGRHFERVETAEDLRHAVASIPGAELTAIQYLDSRGADGKARKYRVMFIDGALYPMHLAISVDWKIHYFTADMAGNPANRAEDGSFVGKMEDVLGARAVESLGAIQEAIGLDYAGIDFGISPEGDVLFFEANATMVVQRPEPGELWDYRRPAVERIFAAVHRMLLRKAGRST